MIDISTWMNTFSDALTKTFGERVWFLGLQGSYGRNEATVTSDIDVVVILDNLSPSDIRTYHAMLDTLPQRDLICGFLSGKDEILNWEPSDLFQFYHDTTPIKGSLEDLLVLIDDSAINRAIKTGVCNIYHACVHNMLHENNEDILRDLYKSASFVIQAIHFHKTGTYVKSQKDLSELISIDERSIIDTFLSLKNGRSIDFLGLSERLFSWAQKQIKKTDH